MGRYLPSPGGETSETPLASNVSAVRFLQILDILLTGLTATLTPRQGDALRAGEGARGLNMAMWPGVPGSTVTWPAGSRRAGVAGGCGRVDWHNG